MKQIIWLKNIAAFLGFIITFLVLSISAINYWRTPHNLTFNLTMSSVVAIGVMVLFDLLNYFIYKNDNSRFSKTYISSFFVSSILSIIIGISSLWGFVYYSGSGQSELGILIMMIWGGVAFISAIILYSIYRFLSKKP